VEVTLDQQGELERLLLEREIERFLYAEAEMLDQRCFEQWLDLLTEDIQYWMPMHRNIKFGDWDRETTKSGTDMNWFDEGKTTLTQRVKQILTGVHWAEEPVSRTCHMVSNVHVLDTQPGADGTVEATVECRFLLYRNNGATVEVTSNPGDGVWVVARYLSSEDDPSQEGQEDMVCITDIRGAAS
jgi:3-phenylpropionate/cinnamic acid dioxygenase small subunit